MIAAIGSGGARPVVWGLGATEADAAANAAMYSDPQDETVGAWDTDGTAYVTITDRIAGRIEAGEVDCASLGIRVRYDRDGHIIDAEVQS